jgi:hypothetical protein
MSDLIQRLRDAKAAKLAANAATAAKASEPAAVLAKPTFALKAPPVVLRQTVLETAAAKAEENDAQFAAAMAQVAAENMPDFTVGEDEADDLGPNFLEDDGDDDSGDSQVVNNFVRAPQDVVRRGVAPAAPIEAPVVNTGIMRRVVAAPVQRPILPTTAPAAPEPASAPSEDQSAFAGRFKAGSTIGALLKRPTQITPAATAAVATGREVYTAADFIQDWDELPEINDESDENDIKSLENDRLSLLTKATAELHAIFDNELRGLSVERANDFSLKSMAELVQVTMLRIKDAPTAWALLDKRSKSAVVSAIRAMSAKRNSSAKSQKPQAAKALSAAQHAMQTAGISDDALASLMSGGFDIG